MDVIRRAAAFAYSFVSLNYEQAVAIKYLRASGGTAASTGAGRDPRISRGREIGGSMMKLVGLGAAMAGVVALSGSPGVEAVAPAMVDGLRIVVSAVWLPVGPALPGAAGGGAALTESASLLLLASGFFGAAILLRRRSRS